MTLAWPRSSLAGVARGARVRADASRVAAGRTARHGEGELRPRRGGFAGTRGRRVASRHDRRPYDQRRCASRHPAARPPAPTADDEGRESGDDGKPHKLKRNISVDQIRRMQARLTTRPTLGDRRAIIVDPADDMERPAANALLKSLEEPPRGSTFLLVAHHAARLLPTIRSRCRVLRFPPLAEGDMDALLRQHAPDAAADARQAAMLAARGSPGAALTFVARELASLSVLMRRIVTEGRPRSRPAYRAGAGTRRAARSRAPRRRLRPRAGSAGRGADRCGSRRARPYYRGVRGADRVGRTGAHIQLRSRAARRGRLAGCWHRQRCLDRGQAGPRQSRAGPDLSPLQHEAPFQHMLDPFYITTAIPLPKRQAAHRPCLRSDRG